ncbi:predicted protein [Plenodomus lingam JN3]|uniref:Uncharacterized protein n=1 Tax=Leptosphaeria maculans (strain JN3 / isolate v23.1.3 / race Av1-4-5-6-7-8) TaxID=985895 RepID=E5A6K7_LEPMJ|nr:predicted protein [Plenodomus lingam JN3]CBX99252.1 predicted protein [Plenodomus lingam JN3]
MQSYTKSHTRDIIKPRHSQKSKKKAPSPRPSPRISRAHFDTRSKRIQPTWDELSPVAVRAVTAIVRMGATDDLERTHLYHFKNRPNSTQPHNPIPRQRKPFAHPPYSPRTLIKASNTCNADNAHVSLH